MTVQQVSEAKKFNRTVYYGDVPGKILAIVKGKVNFTSHTGEVITDIPVKDLTSGDSAAEFLRNTPEEQKALEAYHEMLKSLNSNDYTAILESMDKWDFDSEPVFTGLYLDIYKDIKPKNGGDTFRVFGFRCVADRKVYGLGGKAIQTVAESEGFKEGNFYIIRHIGLVNRPNGRSFRKFDVLEITNPETIKTLQKFLG